MSAANSQNITPDQSSLVPAFDPETAKLGDRRKGIGSSDDSSLFNEGHGCLNRLVRDKRGYPPDYERTKEEKALLNAGHKLEDTVAREALEEWNEKLVDAALKPLAIRRDRPRISPMNPDLRANIDRLIVGVEAASLYHLFPSLQSELGDEPGPGIMEVKTTNQFVLKRAASEGAPLDWILQVQHQFAVAPYKWAIIVAKARDSWMTLPIPVLPDQELIAEISRRATEVMKIVRDESLPLPPPLENVKDERCQGCIYRKSCRGEQFAKMNAALVKEIGRVEYEEDNSLADLANDYKTVRFQLEDLQSLEESIKEQIKARMGEREAISVPGAQIKFLYKTQKGAERIDTRALKAEMPDVAAKYLKTSAPTRTFKPIYE